VPTGYFEEETFFKGLDVRVVDAMLRPYMTAGSTKHICSGFTEKRSTSGTWN